MSAGKWRVVLAAPVVEFGQDFKEWPVDVVARTEDGAMAKASKEFKDEFHRLPHEDEFMKVERMADAST